MSFAPGARSDQASAKGRAYFSDVYAKSIVS